MGDITCCPLSGADYDGPEWCTTTTPVAAKDHTCCECDDGIKKGDKYEKASGSWGGSISTYKTCLSCVEIRDHFACDGFCYGQLWSDLSENFFPDMKAGGPCMEGLSPAAKGRLFEKRLQWMFDSELEIDGAAPPAPEATP